MCYIGILQVLQAYKHHKKKKDKEFIKYRKNITHMVVSYFPVFPVVFTLWWQL